jgi:hypothetical protein
LIANYVSPRKKKANPRCAQVGARSAGFEEESQLASEKNR